MNTLYRTLCTYETPTTDADPDLYPSVSRCIGEYPTHQEAWSAGEAEMREHRALFSFAVTERTQQSERTLSSLSNGRAFEIGGCP